MNLKLEKMQVDALEGNLRAHKETMGKNFQAFRQKVGELNKQVSTLTEEKRQLEAKVESVQQENGSLKASHTPQQPDGGAANGTQIEGLQKQNVCFLISSSILPSDHYAGFLAHRTRSVAHRERHVG